MVTLFCAVVGATGSAFSIDIDTKKSVDHLKDAIKAKKMYQFPADELQLFLAKKANGAWLDGAGLAAVTLDGDGHPQGFEQMDPTLWINNDKHFGKIFGPEEGDVHVLVVVPEGASTPEFKRKRRRMEDAPDAWIKAIKDEQVLVLPSTCEDLREHLLRALRVKVPLDDTLLQTMSLKNTTGELSSMLEKVFEPDPREKLSHITAGILGGVIDPLGSGSEFATEDTYHHLWDSHIALLLRRVSIGRFLRNTNSSTSTGLSRPDMCFYYNNSNVCVFRGEEKASGQLEVPVEELHAKLIWKYDAAPYIFGYAAVGLRVRLVAIRKDKMTESGAKAETIETYNLGDLNSRISFFLALLNLSTLFRPVVDLIQPLEVQEYGTIKRDNGVRIVFAEGCVMKKYPSDMPSDSIIGNLDALHLLMKQHSVPNVVELKTADMSKKYVVLAPVGQLFTPQNIHELLAALRDVLKALVALHAIKVMHRDLRWENVLKYTGEADKWFLIDFDEGAMDPAAPAAHLNPESHAPEILSFHTVKVDIWGVGYLLKTSPIQDLPRELKNMKTQCLEMRPSERPTAESLLEVIESLV